MAVECKHCCCITAAAAVCAAAACTVPTLWWCAPKSAPVQSPCAVDSMLHFCSACVLPVDELERGERSTLSSESMASSHTGRSPSVPRLLDVQEWGYKALAQGIWPAALALFLSVSTSILVFPFFPYVPSSGTFGDALPQVTRLHGTYSRACAWLLLVTLLHCCILSAPLLLEC